MGAVVIDEDVPLSAVTSINIFAGVEDLVVWSTCLK